MARSLSGTPTQPPRRARCPDVTTWRRAARTQIKSQPSSWRRAGERGSPHHRRRAANKSLCHTGCPCFPRAFTSLCYSADGEAVLAGGLSKFVCIYNIREQLLAKKFEISSNLSFDAMEVSRGRNTNTRSSSGRLVLSGEPNGLRKKARM